jgi:hypothetical protein
VRDPIIASFPNPASFVAKACPTIPVPSTAYRMISSLLQFRY